MKKLILLSLTLKLVLPTPLHAGGGLTKMLGIQTEDNQTVDSREVISIVTELKNTYHQNGNLIHQFLKDPTQNPRLRTNVALEFLCDAKYQHLHKELFDIVESDLAIYAYPLAIELRYKTIQQQLHPSLSKAVLAIIQGLFSHDTKESSEKKGHLHTLWENLKKANLFSTYPPDNLCLTNDDYYIGATCHLLTNNDLLALLKYMFNVDPKELEFDRMNSIISFTRPLVLEAKIRKIDFNLNSQNNQGLTPYYGQPHCRLTLIPWTIFVF